MLTRRRAAPIARWPQCTLRGVTQHALDASPDQLRTAALPLLARFGLADAELSLRTRRRGIAPAGGGVVEFGCRPVRTLNSAGKSRSQLPLYV